MGGSIGGGVFTEPSHSSGSHDAQRASPPFLRALGLEVWGLWMKDD